MKLAGYDHIYFLGIGGIGMSALARWFRKKGLAVSGYDRTATTLTSALQQEGMDIHFRDAVDAIPADIVAHPDKTLVVFTPAIPGDHKEFNFLKEQGHTIMKRSQVLGLISEDYKTVAVAGTHGKTTTSSMVAPAPTHRQAERATIRISSMRPETWSSSSRVRVPTRSSRASTTRSRRTSSR